MIRINEDSHHYTVLLMANGNVVIPDRAYVMDGDRLIAYLGDSRHTFTLLGESNNGFMILQESP